MVVQTARVANVLDATRQVFDPEIRSGRHLDASMLESRVLYRASPIDAAPIEAQEPTVDAVDAELPLGDLLDFGQPDGLEAHAAYAAASDDATGAASLDGDGDYDTSPGSHETRHELVFIDAAAQDYQQLLNDLVEERENGRGIDVLLLDADRDGIEQISQALANYDQIDAIHFVTHAAKVP